MDNKTILTENQLNEVTKVLEENKNETDLLLEQIEKEHENDDNSNKPLEQGEGIYAGDGVILESNDSKTLEFNHFDNINSDIEDIIDNNLKDSISSNYDMSEEDVIKFTNLILKVRHNKKIDIYNELPEKLKNHIIDMANEQKIPENLKEQFLQYSAKMIINELIDDVELNSLSIDLEKAMKELIPTPSEMYSETNRDYIENEFPVIAEKIKDEDPIKAQNLLDMRQGFIDSYTFEPMYKLLDNSKIVKNIRRADKTWKRIDNEYISVAAKCKFNLHPLSDILKSLIKIGYSDIESKRIITLFVYTYTNNIEDYNDELEYNNIYRNSFANYFEANISNLAINENLISDFSKNIKENLNKLSNQIEKVITEKVIELSNKNQKKRR